MNILIVDDDLVDRTNIKRTLRRSDTLSDVTEVEDVNSALSILQQQDFDAILLDYNMPQRNGIELLREVRGESLENGSAIIMMSSSEEESLAIECLQAGAQDFIAKSDITGFRLRRAIIGAKARFEMEQKLQQSYIKVKQLAEQDDLTKLANRYLFDETLKLAISNNSRHVYKMALILFDLDHFKYVNDTFGHDVGDTILKKVVNRVQTCFRRSELFSRLGGDEFSIIMSRIDRVDDAEKVALRILKVMEKPFEINGASITMGASIGISIYPDSANNATEMFKRADMAMYKAKHMGRNQLVFFEDEMQRKFLSRYKIENELKEAFNKNQFELHYQPVFSAKSITLCGFEALLRWHPDSGPIYPDEFIPVAEESKLINPIGRWVISEACQQISHWQQDSADELTMAINLSPVQLADEKLIPHIKACLSQFEVRAETLEFELTETALLDDSEKNRQMIREISQLGCKIALDDFGTGYSSISHLHHFPIDTVKIDKSLMPNKNQDDFNYQLVRGLVAMLQYLELNVVAEGLEHQSHLELCQSLNIQRIQGYFLAKPLAVNDIDLRSLSGPAKI